MNSKNNILLGSNADNKKLFVENNDYRHIMLIAPHGSGKGVCFVIPSLLAFEESAIVHDIKVFYYEDEEMKKRIIDPKKFIELD